MWKPRRYALCVVSLWCLSGLELRVAPHAFATPPLSPGEVIARCEDQASRRDQKDAQDDPCTSQRAEELQHSYRAPGDNGPWDSFHWGPYAMSEFELGLLYRPGERRPLWGY